jgi:Flp pilus assembly protein TadD
MKAALQHNPAASAFTDLGVWFADQKQYACAADAFATSIQMQPDQPDAGNVDFMFGLSLYLSGDPKGAVSALQEAERHGFRALKLHLILAAASDQVHWTGSAEAEWRAALAIDGESPEALLGLSNDLLLDNDYAGTIALLDNPVIAGQRTSAQSLNLGLAYAKSGKLEDAARVLRDGLNTSPDSLPLANKLADVLVGLGRFPEAIGVLDLAFAQHPADQDTGVHYLQTLLVASPDKAPELGRKLLAAFPQNWEVLYLNGVLETKDGELQQARTHLEQSETLHPDFALAHDALGFVLARLNDMAGARKQWEEAIALGDNDPEVQQNLAKVMQILGAAK